MLVLPFLVSLPLTFPRNFLRFYLRLRRGENRLYRSSVDSMVMLMLDAVSDTGAMSLAACESGVGFILRPSHRAADLQYMRRKWKVG